MQAEYICCSTYEKMNSAIYFALRDLIYILLDDVGSLPGPKSTSEADRVPLDICVSPLRIQIEDKG